MREERNLHKFPTVVITSAYLLFVVYITLLSRNASLTSKLKLDPLWSYYSWIDGINASGRSIILNIGFFIPIGFLFSELLNQRKNQVVISVLICLVASAIIETAQYFTHLGTCDCDDLINNALGGLIGALLSRWTRSISLKRIFSLLFVAGGIIGCVIASGFSNVTDDTYLRQFYFDIDSVTLDIDLLSFHGCCYVYNRDTPDYSIILRDETGTEYLAKTITYETEFGASAQVNTDKKYEILVKFDGFKTMSTNTYINRNTVEYVAGEIEKPQLDSEMELTLSNALLKAYCSEYDVYVYQLESRLYWLIGMDFQRNTELIFHLHTDEIERLPEERIKYGFDNLGFRIETGEELSYVNDHYRIFAASIPTEYPITAITVGLSINGTVEWMDYFRINRRWLTSLNN